MAAARVTAMALLLTAAWAGLASPGQLLALTAVH
jgi:hypothetical protein